MDKSLPAFIPARVRDDYLTGYVGTAGDLTMTRPTTPALPIVLKPCPFCGSTKLSPIVWVGDFTAALVFCNSCEAQGPELQIDNAVGAEQAQEKVAVAWNTRAVPLEPDAEEKA